LDQAATSAVTAAVSAGPLEPISTVSAFFDEVSLLLLEVVLLPLLKPDPHALSATAPARARAPAASQRVRRCIFSPWCFIAYLALLTEV
jgi:hypothetical protein